MFWGAIRMNQRSWIKFAVLVGYLAFIAISAVIDYSPGKEIGSNFMYFWFDLIKVLPFAFVLIGLLEVWVDRKTVERHLGEESGARGYLWVMVLSSITVGGVFVRPGDVIVADGDGVIVVPWEKVKAVGEFAAEVQAGDSAGRRKLYEKIGLPLDFTVEPDERD